MPDGSVTGWPRRLLRIEGACICAGAAWAYLWLGQPWWLLLALLLVPDLSLLGYAAGARVGAALYNAAHTLAAPLAGLCMALSLGRAVSAGLALIWLAHIGLDRMIGYGLKYGRGFGATHLGAIGRGRGTTPVQP